MAPIPKDLSVEAQKLWDDWVKNPVNVSRKAEYKTEFHEKFEFDSKQYDIPYRQLKLSPSSKTHGDISNITDDLTTLKFNMKVIGTDSDHSGFPLYIAMHGGGGTTDKDENNEQWYNMTTFYHGQLDKGIYIATRGMGDTWDLHFQKASYVLIEKLIENMIMFENVNSNRVYLLGFSAGGDGVYRLVNHLPQRFAAANAGGGHAEDIKFDNLMNVPLCLQVGERDSNFHRCMNVAQAGVALNTLRTNTKKYEHDAFIHPTDPTTIEPNSTEPNSTGKIPTKKWAYDDYINRHWKWEESNASLTPAGSHGTKTSVIANIETWSARNPTTAQDENLMNCTGPFHVEIASSKDLDQKNTNAIDWVNQWIRFEKPFPERVVWNLGSISNKDNWGSAIFQDIAGRGGHDISRSQHYWLDIGQHSPTEVGTFIDVSIETNNNTVVINKASGYLRILLRPSMMNNLSKPITVKILGSSTLSIIVNQNNPTVIRDTLIRNDPYLIFTSDIILNQDPNTKNWTATTSPMA